ncbi:MAG: subfamily B ATP-binding cassette protein MsbA [Candidatus Promineifilaceae bacterium]|jgi:subfamily B ATP-binding cassette protein MsbA
MSSTKQRTAWSSYRRLLRYTRPYTLRLTVAIIAGLMFAGSVFSLLTLSPRILKPFGQNAAIPVAVEAPDNRDVDATVVPSEIVEAQKWADKLGVTLTKDDGTLTWQGMVLMLAFIPVVALIWLLANYLNRYLMRWVGARVIRDLRDDLFSHLQHQSLAFFGGCDIGKLISRCTNDAVIVEHTVYSTAAQLVRAPLEITAAMIFVFMFSHQHEMGGFILMMLFVYGICIVPVVILGLQVKRHTRQALSRVSDLVSRMHENFTGVRVVKAYAMEKKESQRFAKMNEGYFRSSIKALRAELMMTPMMEGLGIVMAVAFLVFCYARNIELFQIVPICMAAVVAYRPIKQLANLNSNLQRGAAALERIFELMDTSTIIPEAEKPVPVSAFENRIQFENVGFAYDVEGAPVLSDINLDITKGMVIAIVGQTGSGKSTMANLLARFYDPTAGRILLDGVDLRDMKIADLRKLIGVVTQDTILFNDTIANNIAYGAETVDMDAVKAAAREANADMFISADPDGYNRIVGEKGFLLSGGEKQRVALARAILRNPPILILDEATSALDTVTEQLVQEAITRVMKERTVFAIAHRLSTVRNADLILVVEGGRIVERGTHDELYAADGSYRALCDMQLTQ